MDGRSRWDDRRRQIRILTVYNKSFYFVDKGVQRGSSYDIGRLFVDDINSKLIKDAKTKHLKVQYHLHPGAARRAHPALIAGKGDVAIGILGITEERLKQVDFSPR